jgi:hypothetical protein
LYHSSSRAANGHRCVPDRGRGCLATCGDVHPHPGPSVAFSFPADSVRRVNAENRESPPDVEAPRPSADVCGTEPVSGVAPLHDAPCLVPPCVGTQWPPDNMRSLRFGYLNVRGCSAPAKLTAVALEMRSKNLAFLILGETRYSGTQTRQTIVIPNDASHSYYCFHFPAALHRGGISVMLRRELLGGSHGIYITDLESVTQHAVSLTLTAFGQDYRVVGVYLPSRGSIAQEHAILEQIAEVLPRARVPTIVLISDFRFQISDFRFQISDFRFQISDFRFQGLRPGPATSLFS